MNVLAIFIASACIALLLASASFARSHRKSIYAVLFLWLIPVLFQGVTERPLPGLSVVEDLHNLGGLFAKRVTMWEFYDIQVRPRGSREWIRLPEGESLFRLAATGKRNRAGEFLSYTDISDQFEGEWGKKQRQDLADWIYVTRKARFPAARPIRAIRFVKGWYRTGAELRTEGPFPLPPHDRATRFRILSTHVYPQGGALAWEVQ